MSGLNRISRREPSMGAPIHPLRLGMVFVLLVALAGTTLWRLVDIQLVQHQRFTEMTRKAVDRTITLKAERGAILDRRGRHLVENLQGYGSVAVRPDSLRNRRAAVAQLAGLLDLPVDHVRSRCSSRDPFVWIDRQIEPERLDRVEELALAGVEVHREPMRGYPYGTVAGQVLGHVRVDGVGAAGIEQLYEPMLSGQDGRTLAEIDRRGHIRYDDSYLIDAPVDGGTVRLSLDIDAQAIVEEELARAVEEHGAAGGSIVITRPLTGEILAIASWPGYDPNHYQVAPVEQQRNRAITDVYEPGSTFKIVPFAAVLERNLVDIEEVIDVEHGKWMVGGRPIHDTKVHDYLTVREGFAKSSNILTGKLASLMTFDEFYTVMRDFGFGQRTGIDLVGEVGGILPPVSRWSGVSQANMAMGQGVAVTTLQLAMAYGAIACDGHLMRPLLVRSVVSPDGEVETYEPQVVRTVVTPRTARIIRKLMQETVQVGTGVQASMEGHAVAGKTGTAQKPKPDGSGYADSSYIASFAGFLPADNPEWLAVVVIDDPQGSLYYGGSVAGPVFRRIMQRLLVTVPMEATPNHPIPTDDPRALPANLVMLPSLHACTESEAMAALEGLGLVGRVVGDGSVVVAQSAPEGSCLPRGETVQLTLGGRTAASDIVAPEVRRKPLRDAIATLARHGLCAVVEGSGLVVSQQPSPGELLALGEEVRLVAEPMLETAR